MRKCSICKNSFEGMGHNPMPLKEYTERCCDDCNNDFVIPTRLDLLGRNIREDIQ
jgi:hypothetical protein|tara:strand:- start:629 stop:793 length:165 start_codon:yes stop_codon:yes gene_type:complete